MPQPRKQGVASAVLQDLEHRENQVRLVRDGEGVIWAEVQCRHNGVEVFSTLKLGQNWQILPRLTSLL
jgi:hypothetical protein